MGIAPRSTDWDVVIVVAVALFGAALFGTICFIAIHFIIKFW